MALAREETQELSGRAVQMSARAKALITKVDRLMIEAAAALEATHPIACERTAHEALQLAHQAQDYERMSRIVLLLQEARRLRRQAATDVKKVMRLSSYGDLEPLLTGGKPIKTGCYLIEPPLVGADGRELRERALAEGVAVFVIVREPETRLKHWPVVAVGATTVRARLTPPKKIDSTWMQQAGEALGDAGMTMVDFEECPADRADHLLQIVTTIVDHEKLHQAFTQACAEAARELAANPKKAARRKPPSSDGTAEFAEEAESDL